MLDDRLWPITASRDMPLTARSGLFCSDLEELFKTWRHEGSGVNSDPGGQRQRSR